MWLKMLSPEFISLHLGKLVISMPRLLLPAGGLFDEKHIAFSECDPCSVSSGENSQIANTHA